MTTIIQDVIDDINNDEETDTNIGNIDDALYNYNEVNDHVWMNVFMANILNSWVMLSNVK